MADSHFWQDRRVLVTGCSGILGSWLTLRLLDLGADVVGMTLVPEVFLAAEFGLPYAARCIVTNLAAGRSTPESGRRFGVEVGREGLTACRRAAALMQS